MNEPLAPQEQVDQLMTLLEITRILNSTLERSRLLRIIVRSATKLLACEDSSILLIDPASGELRFEASAGLAREMVEPITVPLDASIAGWIVRNQKPLIITDVQHDPRFFNRVDQATGTSTRSLLGVPMYFKERVIGVLEAINKKEGTFSTEDEELLTILAAQAAVAVENARLLDELRRANRELSELDRLKSEFITTASHELRTPLTAIRGYLRLLLADMVPPEQRHSILQTIAGHVEAMVHQVNDILFLQEVEAVRFEFLPVDMEALVYGEVEAVRERAQQAGISLTVDVCHPLPTTRGDVAHLRRMLHNLLDNAIKFSPDGGEVTVRLHALGDSLCLEVSDQGVGIPAEEREKIFEQFYRIEKVGDRLFGGLGLGLSIARHIAEKHGGRIGVESEVGRGSTFRVILPSDHEPVT